MNSIANIPSSIHVTMHHHTRRSDEVITLPFYLPSNRFVYSLANCTRRSRALNWLNAVWSLTPVPQQERLWPRSPYARWSDIPMTFFRAITLVRFSAPTIDALSTTACATGKAFVRNCACISQQWLLTFFFPRLFWRRRLALALRPASLCFCSSVFNLSGFMPVSCTFL